MVTEEFKVLAAGSNKSGLAFALSLQLADGSQAPTPISYDTPIECNFTVLNSLLRFKVASIVAGKGHSVALTIGGQVITFGANNSGQLGVGDTCARPHSVCQLKGALSGKIVTQAAAGDAFTVLATRDNEVFVCGSNEEGRLGLEIHEGTSSSAAARARLRTGRADCVLTPRPAISALYRVASLACNEWITAMVAERELSRKTLQENALNELLAQSALPPTSPQRFSPSRDPNRIPSTADLPETVNRTEMFSQFYDHMVSSGTNNLNSQESDAGHVFSNSDANSTRSKPPLHNGERPVSANSQQQSISRPPGADTMAESAAPTWLR